MVRWLALMLALVAAGEARAQDIQAKAIQVLRAAYGPQASRANQCPASGSVRALCNGRMTCRIPVRDQLCVGRPPPGLVMSLIVEFTCGAGTGQRTVTETKPFILQLTCQ